MSEPKAKIDVAAHVTTLIVKANNAASAGEAVQYSQAALNCANAMRLLMQEERQ